MHNDEWRLQDAKTQLSQVVNAALDGTPQHITRRGKRAVVVLSESAFEALQQQQALPTKERTGFIGHLLAMPRDDKDFAATAVPLRKVEL